MFELRLHSLTLTNYIGIYNGMGLENIYIDFSRCKNNIIVIKGDNGSGKSTIFKALTPMGDNSDDLIPGKPAQKSISYIMDDRSIINIIYTYPINKKGERGQTKCNIFKIMGDTTIDLNPNGNIGEAKDMIDTLFDFDQNFVSLSQLSSEDRGLADKKPSERKKFINSIIESMSEYNTMYKKLVKKSSALKMNMVSINTKIGSIGNKEMIANRLKVLQDTLGNLEDRRNMLLANMGALKARADQINCENIILSTRELKVEIVKLNAYFNSNPYNYLKKHDKLEEEIIEIEKKIQDTKVQKAVIEEKCNNAKLLLFKNNQYLRQKEVELDYYIEADNYAEILNNIADVQKEIERAKQWMEENSSDIGVTEQDVKSAEVIVANINKELHSLQNNDMKDAAIIHVFEGKYSMPSNREIDNELISLNNRLNALHKKLGTLSSKSAFDKMKIPKDCMHIETCPLAIAYNAQSSSVANYNKVSKQIELIKEEIHKWNVIKRERIHFKEAKRSVKDIFESFKNNKDLLHKFGIRFANDNQISLIIEATSEITLDMEIFRNSVNYKSLIASNTMRLGELKEKEMKLRENNKAIDSIRSDIAKYKSSTDEMKDNISALEQLCSDKSSELQKLSSTIDSIKKKIYQRDMYHKRMDLMAELKSLEDKYTEAQEITKKLSSIKSELDDVTGSKYTEVTEEIEGLKHRLVLYNEYVEEYKQFSQKYEVIDKIKKYTSPTTGIQTVFMGMYMNDIINTSNQLLSLMFGGEYVLHPFVINENEFRIPCSGRGLLNDDISSMSTSQICMISMIISFALLHKASSVYNIIKLDEMDGGLDTQNRVNFIILLQKMMGLLNVEQCIMISHNSELLMQNADIIMLRNSDPNLKIDGNVIFKI